jgi:hypothetical protein
VSFVEVTVHEGADFVAPSSDAQCHPYFYIHLNSTEKVKYKSKICRETTTPKVKQIIATNRKKWEQKFGFELASTPSTTGKIQDGIRLRVRSYNATGPAYDVYVILPFFHFFSIFCY